MPGQSWSSDPGNNNEIVLQRQKTTSKDDNMMEPLVGSGEHNN
jgi:hypothetical protein